MFHKVLIALGVSLAPQTLHSSRRPTIVQWNVGQGSWTTYINSQLCVHVDAGGEWRHFTSLCRKKKNILFFTHYDWDHINFSQKIQHNAKDVCRAQHIPENISPFKRSFLEKISFCYFSNSKILKKVYSSGFSEKNESHAFIMAEHFLITGDASQKVEKKWLKKSQLQHVQLLLAGHHGSRTSLSKDLLRRSRSLKMIFVSCRKKRYGHPHPDTKKKAEDFGLPLLITEHFGSIAVEVPD